MAIHPTLADGESFVPGRSIEKARELLEAAAAAGLPDGSVRTASHGYIVPSELVSAAAEESESAEGEDHESEDKAPEEFDPSAATVDEVKGYLEGVDDEEFARVIAAEKASDKPRKGITDLAAPEGE
jgi:hypothetical protein